MRLSASARVADGVLLLCTAIWGTTFVVVKAALADADAMTFLALRFSLGALVAALFARSALRHPMAWRGGALLGVLLFFGYALQTWGLELTTPSRSAFITGLSVALVPFAQLLIFRQRPSAWAMAGVAVAVAGLVLLTGVQLDGALPKGDLLTLGCAVVYAFHIALTGRYAPLAPPAALVTVQLLVTAALAAAAAPLGSVRLVPTAALAGAVLLTGVLASAVAITAQAWAQARTSPVHAALIFSLEPLFAAALSAALGLQPLATHEVLGGATLIAGVLLAELAPRASKDP